MTIKKRGLERPVLGGAINFPVTLAPMVGLSHSSFRRLLMDYLPESAQVFWPTEMLNSRKIPLEVLGSTAETYRHPTEQGLLVPQILGNEEDAIRRSVTKLQDWGVSGIDINMGCPVAKALKHNYGVALLGDPEYAANVVRMTTRWAQVPVSVKLRAMESGELDDLKRFVEGLIEAGASWLTLHPRPGSLKRRGEADWNQITWLRQQITCPLIGNGDIQVAEDVERMLDNTGCDMVMVGRALTARPWLFWQLGEQWGWAAPKGLKNAQPPRTPQAEAQEYGRALIRLLGYMSEDFNSEALALRKFRFFVKTGSPWLDFGQNLVGVVHQASSVAALRGDLALFFEQELSMCQRTELRQ
jgi:tRNA-dihydrouridine synthase